MVKKIFILLLLIFPAISFNGQNPAGPPVEDVSGSIKHKKSEGKFQEYKKYKWSKENGGMLLFASLVLIGIVLLHSWYKSRKKRGSN